MEEAVAELTAIAGQKAVVTRAKKSIAAFKLREGMPTALASPCARTACGTSWTSS